MAKIRRTQPNPTSPGTLEEGHVVVTGLIHKIMGHVRKLLPEDKHNIPVNVAYFLVCLLDASKHQWKMPVGWEQYTKIQDHRGDAYCLRISTYTCR